MLPDEPPRWFARYEAFRLLGPNRSVLAVYNAGREKASKGKSHTFPSSWGKAAEKWRWRERAVAWDASERQRRAKDQAESLAASREVWRQIGVTMRRRVSDFLDLFPETEVPGADFCRFAECAQRFEQGGAEESLLLDLEQQVQELMNRGKGKDDERSDGG